MTAQWKSDTEIVELVGDAWVEELEFGGAIDSASDRAKMVAIANEWLADAGFELRVTDVADAEDEMNWCIAD